MGSSLSQNDKEQLIYESIKNDKEILIVPHLNELLLSNYKVERIDDMMVYNIKSSTLVNYQKFFKRLMDIMLALILLLVCFPVMLFLYVYIPINSKGKAIYSQERVGINGSVFKLLKFRSMLTDAEKITGPVLASANDPRITSIGKFIRLTRMDELPQLINVLLGQMSFVGPRPEREFYVKQFQEQMPLYSERHTVKPGLTGFAQVMGKYSTTVEEKLKYDLMYINNYSLILDIRIIIKTLFVVIKREQAVGVNTENELQIEKYIS
jgi:exopolysaccharide biosynthesis polyprenyl glycosylphosphotransferase